MMAFVVLSYFWSCFMLLFLAPGTAQGISWGSQKRVDARSQIDHPIDWRNPSDAKILDRRMPNKYVVALNELQELESEPLCHRIAARQLVSNCQLLDGQDDATVLTDSGRATRDFVDFYAASLAICDLERGSFVIPPVCSKFREPALASLPALQKPQLHVSTSEIDNCLEGLAQSDSAWNTWVSYRHKALRFCEAARGENEKDQSIHLHQKLTRILERLTTEVEQEMEQRLRSLYNVFRDTNTVVETIKPQVDSLKDSLVVVADMLDSQIVRASQKSAILLEAGLEDANALRHLLSELLVEVLDKSTTIAASQEYALQVATVKTTQELGIVMTTLAAAISSSTSLQSEINNVKSQTVEIARQQEQIQAGMLRLDNLADQLSLQQDGHQTRLDSAEQSATRLLGVIDAATVSAASFQNSLSNDFGWTAWWPYILCPATSLFIGSYGLPPSIIRNLALIGLGEVAGVFVSVANRYRQDGVAAFINLQPSENIMSNKTIYFKDDLTSFKDEKYIRTDIFVR